MKNWLHPRMWLLLLYLDGEDFQHNQDGEVELEFIGNVVDLVLLRPELSFLLVIDNPELGKNYYIQVVPAY